ncbi:MAG: LysR family transcriptional regulator [Alphaproteobacteria bacterium BRH_c36]|nr:MAG: LysR family transcriptional regulator [Alphaproteobacteria bacterium BRH_c36]
MDRLHEMEVFVAVVDSGSFARAGTRLRISPPAVTRAVSSLEERLGTRLLNRTTRSLNLTEAGKRFLESCRRLLADVDEAEKEAIGETAVPQGHLTVTASVTFGRIALRPIISGFLAQHPRITVSLILLDRVVDLVDEGIDVAVRIGSLPDSSVIARRVGEVRRVMTASADYLANRGTPHHPADLKRHDLIAFTGLMSNRELRFDDNGRPSHITFHPRFEVNDAAAAISAAEAGDGIATALCYMVGEKMRKGQLLPVLQPYWPAPAPVQIAYPHSRLLAAKVRAFVDWSAPRLATALSELSAVEKPEPRVRKRRPVRR